MPSVVTIDKHLAEEILLHLEYTEDEGPIGEGWKSQELQRCIQQLKKAIQQGVYFDPASGPTRGFSTYR